jgi:alpha-L-fucosidase 2
MGVPGACARGGFELDLEWKNSKLTKAVIRSEHGGGAQLRYGEQVMQVEVNPGRAKSFPF